MVLLFPRPDLCVDQDNDRHYLHKSGFWFVRRLFHEAQLFSWCIFARAVFQTASDSVVDCSCCSKRSPLLPGIAFCPNIGIVIPFGRNSAFVSQPLLLVMTWDGRRRDVLLHTSRGAYMHACCMYGRRMYVPVYQERERQVTTGLVIAIFMIKRAARDSDSRIRHTTRKRSGGRNWHHRLMQQGIDCNRWRRMITVSTPGAVRMWDGKRDVRMMRWCGFGISWNHLISSFSFSHTLSHPFRPFKSDCTPRGLHHTLSLSSPFPGAAGSVSTRREQEIRNKRGRGRGSPAEAEATSAGLRRIFFSSAG